MPKKIFINNLDTYVSQAIFAELRNDVVDEEGNMPDDVNQIFGSYINKDSSNYPKGVTKMLKVRKRFWMLYDLTCGLTSIIRYKIQFWASNRQFVLQIC